MQNKNDYITMLGTGNALATRCYNTCFTLHGEKGVLLVDAGGGNGILTQLEKAGIRREDISDLFVTHAHTDHLLGCVWIMRMALQFNYTLRVWSHKKVLQLLTDICSQILPHKEAEGIGSLVTMNCLSDGEQFEAGGSPCNASTSIPLRKDNSASRHCCPMANGSAVWAMSLSVHSASNMPRVPTG